MHITFTDSAVDQLKPHLQDGERSLKLLYDTEGCGCVVSGVPALMLVQEGEKDDVRGQGDPFEVLYQPRYEVFFEPKLTIDYSPQRRSFTLKSDNQIYTNELRFMRT
ncbi:iron-sulfur cluster biosynthesis family protein [Paenibacillus beijingensis]|uniref:Core domain-containing protein n=1 Tax=Paenibacillus beijingensis TaxID=1126833 RepID=A0A0D5NP43_9BACL|nr:iron-sulfur cluster biosynthesis family protein [Paenibacillus beijingensis]AJY77094.1 hypothetical protein VN24_24275 [Paenibacillus beijingensis]